MLWGFIKSLLGGGLLNRALDTVDKRIETTAQKDVLKKEIITAHLTTRVGFMRAGGFTLMLLFAVPLAVWFGAVVLYSIFFCADCMYPKPWTIAALPAPLDEWAGAIIVSIFSVVGLGHFSRNR